LRLDFRDLNTIWHFSRRRRCGRSAHTPYVSELDIIHGLLLLLLLLLLGTLRRM
jgi:hypothetical protein